jgi:hypothetical protein
MTNNYEELIDSNLPALSAQMSGVKMDTDINEVRCCLKNINIDL